VSAAPLRAAFGQAFSEGWAGGGGPLLPLGFLIGAAVLVPLGIGTDPDTLRALGPGLIWSLMALASLVTLERLFQADLEDGALDLWIQSGSPLSLIATSKTLAHWLVSGVPLALAVPALRLLFQADATLDLLRDVPLYLMGSLGFFLWGGVGAALAAGIRRSGLLTALIVLPLYAPTAIFGALALTGTAGQAAPLFFGANILVAFAVAPFAMAAALRLAAD
jgi:heme exporter protein B